MFALFSKVFQLNVSLCLSVRIVQCPLYRRLNQGAEPFCQLVENVKIPFQESLVPQDKRIDSCLLVRFNFSLE